MHGLGLQVHVDQPAFEVGDLLEGEVHAVQVDEVAQRPLDFLLALVGQAVHEPLVHLGQLVLAHLRDQLGPLVVQPGVEAVEVRDVVRVGVVAERHLVLPRAHVEEAEVFHVGEVEFVFVQLEPRDSVAHDVQEVVAHVEHVFLHVQERTDDRRLLEHFEAVAHEQDPGQLDVAGQLREHLADERHLAGGVDVVRDADRAEVNQVPEGVAQVLLGRVADAALQQLQRLADLRDLGLQDHFLERAAHDLRVDEVVEAVVEVVLGHDAEAVALGDPARPAFPLLQRRPGGLLQVQALHAVVRAVVQLLVQPEVDHERHVRDGDGRLGDVGREDDLPLALARLLERLVVGLDLERRVQLEDVQVREHFLLELVGTLGQRLQLLGERVDFLQAGQEHQHGLLEEHV